MVIIFLADGFEECEALCPLDMLIRAGLEVKTVSISENKTVTGSHSISVIADLTLSEFVSADFNITAVILPGGMPGTTNLLNCPSVISTVKKSYEDNKLVCAICAAPSILASIGLLKDKRATCFPGFEEQLGDSYTDEAVVSDGNIITAKSMGVAYKFGFAIIEKLCGKAKASTLAESMIYQ